jgi:hypothetical protein
MPANYKVPAHYHPKDETVTVISGDFHVGMGDKLDMQKASAGRLNEQREVQNRRSRASFAYVSGSCRESTDSGQIPVSGQNSGDRFPPAVLCFARTLCWQCRHRGPVQFPCRTRWVMAAALPEPVRVPQ